MEPKILSLAPKQLIGMHLRTSLVDNRTAELWQRFRPRVAEIAHRAGSDFVSMQIFDHVISGPVRPDTLFEKWAAVEVSELGPIPAGMEPYRLAGGQYAVFVHRGPVTSFPQTVQFIFGTWLPRSQFRLDAREQFEVLPASYRPMDPDATEEVWVPIRAA